MCNARWTIVVFLAAVACWQPIATAAPQGDKKIEQLKEAGEFNTDSQTDKVKVDHPIKLYALPCVAGRTYTIDMRSDDFDAYLRLDDPTGKTIKEDDDSGGGKNGTDAQIKFKADKAGTFTIVATSFAPGARGKYILTVVHDGAGTEEQPAGGKYLLDVTAKLTKDDPKDKDRGGTCYCKTYKIDMSAGKTYVIQLDSRDFDAYLRLVNAEGKEVAFDDDGAKDGLNAKLVHACTNAGTYTIVATSFAHPDTGEFHLRVHVKDKEAQP